MKVLLEPSVWLTDDDDGDPPRTHVEANAHEFNTMSEAMTALAEARKYRPFVDAQILDDFV